ncbi:MAG: deoxyribose-phosphate aldolase [Christensenellales bacterium]|jgi:deoxyribose-phosphate aldolase
MKIARYIDHAILKPDMTEEEARRDIALGLKYHVRTVCVQPANIALALSMCEGTDTDVCCVLDFPHGAGGAAAKEAAAAEYAALGAFEIDMVMNIGAARSGRWDVVKDEIERVVRQAHAKNVPVKVIFETCFLNPEEIAKATEVSAQAGADFVKTSTGFATGGATVEAVKIMLDAAKGRIKVKASGGIRDYETAKRYVDMGVDRLGVGAKGSAAICEEETM